MERDSFDLRNLRDEIAAGRALVLVGAGVSIGATEMQPALQPPGFDDPVPLASWPGLLLHGVEFCEQTMRPTAGWGKIVREEIKLGDLESLLSAATKIERQLDAPSGGRFRTWLRESIGALKATKLDVIQKIVGLNCPIATTNYDDLIEKVNGWGSIHWKQGNEIQRILDGKEHAVIHFHGYWKNSETVVLGHHSYDAIVRDPNAQALLHIVFGARTVLLVGFGAGLDDPNFGPLMSWIREAFKGSEKPHYRLKLIKHPGDPKAEYPIVPLDFGKDFKDLAPFLGGLIKSANRVTHDSGAGDQRSPLVSRQPSRIPAVGYCFGRDELVADLVATMLQDNPPPTAMLGGPGHGKTTVSLKALHDSRGVGRFGARRYFVRCDSARTRDALAAEIALTMGLEAGPNLEARALTELELDRAVLVLDNLETPWEADPLGTEDLLAQLAAVPGLCLVASVRGMQRPQGVAWREPIGIPPLDLPAARQALLAIAGERFRTDPRLDELINAVDRVPLAISLLAYQAEGQPDLAGIWGRWQSERTKMLQRSGGGTRLTNLELSLEMSVNGPRMNDAARQLLSLLGVLPDGIAWQDLDTLLPAQGSRAAGDLRRVGLAVDEEAARRLRVLAPVREFVHARYVPGDALFSHAIEHYLALAAEEGNKVGADGGAESIVRIAPEFNNLEAMVLAGLSRIGLGKCIDAARGLGELIRFTGLGAPYVLERAAALARSTKDAQNEANCIKSLGNIALARSDHDEARRRYDEAIPLYRKVGAVGGEANCIQGLGDIALRRSDHDEARRRYDEAIPLYRKVGDVLGEANCIQGLGDIALERTEKEQARGLFENALELYGRISQSYSIGMAHRRLARIALNDSQRRGHVAAARAAWASIKRDDLLEELRREFREDPL
jgi:tetratricopeptide (TPR) repeat protein